MSSVTSLGILIHSLRFYIAKEFLSSLQFFFSRRVIAVPSLEEMYPRQREAALGTRRKATRVKWGEFWGNKLSKKIRNVAWLVNLMNIKSIQKLLFGLNVDERHGDKRGK